MHSPEVEMGQIFLSNIFNEIGKVPSDIPSDTKNSIRVVHKIRILKNLDLPLISPLLYSNAVLLVVDPIFSQIGGAFCQSDGHLWVGSYLFQLNC